jgi:hypothetical protein
MALTQETGHPKGFDREHELGIGPFPITLTVQPAGRCPIARASRSGSAGGGGDQVPGENGRQHLSHTSRVHHL